MRSTHRLRQRRRRKCHACLPAAYQNLLRYVARLSGREPQSLIVAIVIRVLDRFIAIRGGGA